MAAQVAPAPVYRLHAPQLDDEHPDQTPYVIFSRQQSANADLSDFCAADALLADTYLVDCYDLDYAGARELARQMTAVFAAFNAAPDYVDEAWESDVRIYRISTVFAF